MSEKTEQPTAKKLREAREEGNVAKSKDFTQTVLVVALFGYMIANGRGIAADFMEMIAAPAGVYGMPLENALRLVGGTVLRKGVDVLLPFLMIVLTLGVFAELLQTGILLAFKSLMPSAKKLNPIDNAKNMFSKKNLVEFVKSLLKIAFLSVLIYLLIRGSLDPLMKVPIGGVAGVGEAVGALLKQLIVYTALAYTVVAAADFGWQRFHWKKELMMSKDEVHREYKEMEGDPHIKSHRKALAQEIAMGDGVQKAAKASVIVTNPTHVAIAIYYEEGETPLPTVLSKGENLVAARMIAVAEEAGVPVMRNVPLARALLETAQVDQYVPSELLEPVAEVLRVVRSLREKRSVAMSLPRVMAQYMEASGVGREALRSGGDLPLVFDDQLRVRLVPLVDGGLVLDSRVCALLAPGRERDALVERALKLSLARMHSHAETVAISADGSELRLQSRVTAEAALRDLERRLEAHLNALAFWRDALA